ncbi:SorC family transcriptional regulator [Ligilactobacillus sp. WILCCON 0076]|uniref:SorC family transcriptional regulator n=1 Tax=Ligilactobacillus ubinensis TaxID=2876789 RepID=A0A9X2FKC4_9LACO|nr:sugar-binding domain-containing protein [Ligilactobacillus ubinensis]MCP0886341.1 SorC family transcriptional regulator [Ligilactobacillus ubinensis]
MHQELEWIELIAPDMVDVISQRFKILQNISWTEPVGRRSLAQMLGMSERVLRTDTDFLKKQELISVTKSGMILTAQGYETIHGLTNMIDQLLGLQQLEKKLCGFLGIKRCLIVSGDSDNQPQFIDAMGKLVNDSLQMLLPKGKNIVAVMGGTTMARVAKCLTPEIMEKREVLFVPARGGIGERADIQANNVCAQMALKTGGKHRALYVPEHVSEKVYRPLLTEPAIQEVVSLIKDSNAVIHSIGEAMHMAKRRAMPESIVKMLIEKHAVGEAFGYFFDEYGHVVYRIPRIGLQLEDLASMDCILAVAGGSSKAKAIRAYMQHAPKNTCLITDEGAAKVILKE